jgi:hypothetical protein
MIEAGANPKDVQGQMRHSRISTTMDIHAQFVPESHSGAPWARCLRWWPPARRSRLWRGRKRSLYSRNRGW